VALRAALAGLDRSLRYGIWSALILGAMGCIAGLIIGLTVYAPTAWFATFELGIPCAVVGFALGTATGGVAHAVHKVRTVKSAT
jgi:hypothetical protein